MPHRSSPWLPKSVIALRTYTPEMFRQPKLPPVLILRLRNMTALDGTGLQALEEIAERTRASGRTAIFCGAREQPRAMMRQAGFARHVGIDNVCPHVEAALMRAASLHDQMGASPAS